MLSDWPFAVAMAYRQIQGQVSLAAPSCDLPGAGHWAHVSSCWPIVSQQGLGLQAQQHAWHVHASLHYTEP